MTSSTAKSLRKQSPRSLLNWINSPNTKQVQKKMANRIGYLKFIASNKNALLSDIALMEKQQKKGEENESNIDVHNKMNQLLMLSDDPKVYY
jgi:hypothetical protein